MCDRSDAAVPARGTESLPRPARIRRRPLRRIPVGSRQAGAVVLVPALRSQSADVRAQHLLRAAGGLSEGDPARLSRAGGPRAAVVYRTPARPIETATSSIAVMIW